MTSRIRVIQTDAAPSHTGPVPQAVEAGGWVFVSALFGTDPATGHIPEEPDAEVDQLFANLTAVLAAADLTLTDVVRVGIFMKDLQADRPAFNRRWAHHFGDHRPARSAVGVTDFGRPGEGGRFMLEITALCR